MGPVKVASVLDLIGDTPLVRINRMNPAPGVELLAKLEMRNPGGSVKDRIALRMIQQAEASGELTPGKIVLEASSGNTAIGLAVVCAVKGYQLLVTMSESASEERKRILRAYGAQILLTPGYRGTDGAIEEAYRLGPRRTRQIRPGRPVQQRRQLAGPLRGHGPGNLGGHRRQGQRRGAHDGDHRDLDGHQPRLAAARSGGPRRRRRTLQGPQDPGPQEYEGELPAGNLQARRALGDRLGGRRFGLRDRPPPGPRGRDLRGHERRGGHEGGHRRGAGLGPRHRRGPAARRRRALPFHFALRFRDGPRAAAILQHPAPAAWNNWSRSRRAR